MPQNSPSSRVLMTPEMATASCKLLSLEVSLPVPIVFALWRPPATINRCLCPLPNVELKMTAQNLLSAPALLLEELLLLQVAPQQTQQLTRPPIMRQQGMVGKVARRAVKAGS